MDLRAGRFGGGTGLFGLNLLGATVEWPDSWLSKNLMAGSTTGSRKANQQVLRQILADCLQSPLPMGENPYGFSSFFGDPDQCLSGFFTMTQASRLFFVMAALACSCPLYAEVIDLEGTVKSIDKDARTLSVVRKTPKGEKVLELEVAKKAGDLSGLAEGQSISLRYDPDLEIVFKLTLQHGSPRPQPPREQPPIEEPAIDAATVERITASDARRLTAAADFVLSLPGLRELSPEAARELATYREQSKTAPGTVMVPVSRKESRKYSVMVPVPEEVEQADGTKVTVNKCRPEERTMTVSFTVWVPETSDRKCPFTLQMDGLNSLKASTLAEIAKHSGNLLLNGLRSVTVEEAKVLAAHNGGVLALDGLESLEPEAALHLAAHGGGLSLDGISSLSRETSEALASHRWGELALNCVKSIEDDVAAAIAMHGGPVSLNGATEVSEKARQILVRRSFILPPEMVSPQAKETE